jgi:N-acyl-D-aspartate/D-glutamate deacylase
MRPAVIARIVALLTMAALAAGFAAAVADDQPPVDADVLLSGGLVFDGTGRAPEPGNVAIVGERIVAVGKFTPGKVGRMIDCQGRIVAPGFIDLHNHSDFPILEEGTRAAENYLTQGCTTIVTGNCGGGQVKVGEFLDQLAQQGAGVNLAHLVPIGSVRSRIIGDVKRAPTPEELEQMRQLVSQGMEDGAWGISSGLIYVPGAYADTDEIVALAEVAGKHGGIYASHIRGEGATLLDAVAEAIEIGRRARLPVHVSHFKASGRAAWGNLKAAAALIEQAHAAGQVVTADQYPYTASSTSLEAMLLSAADREGGKKALAARLADPEQLPKLREEITTALKDRDQIQIAAYHAKPAWAGKLISKIAAEENRDQADVAIEILANGGAQAVNFGMQEEEVRFAMRLPWVATASDGSTKLDDGSKPHPRSFGTFTRKIGPYVRQQVVSLQHALRSCTGLPADILGLPKRGYVRAGYFADLVVFDPNAVRDEATYEEPFKHSTGMSHVFVNGSLAIEGGKATGALKGKPLRHVSAAQ